MTQAIPSLIIRADADPRIGFGHVMRCLALAQRWKDQGGSVIFASRPLPELITKRLAAEGCEVQTIKAEAGSPADLREYCELLQQHHSAISIIDGYKFDRAYQYEVQQIAERLLVIDDCGDRERYAADVLLNQNLDIEPPLYAGRFDGELLLGPEYALIRREFLREHAVPKTSSPETPTHRVLVSLGGSDPGRITQRVIDAFGLLADHDLSVTLVSGAAGLDIDDSRFRVIAFEDDMSGLYRTADMVICGGGSSNWEMCRFGLPRLLIVLAANQLEIARALEREQCCRSLGWYDELTSRQIADALLKMLETDLTGMRTVNQRLVDGRGAERIAGRLLQFGRPPNQPGKNSLAGSSHG